MKDRFSKGIIYFLEFFKRNKYSNMMKLLTINIQFL
jgi:hypothetical protein